MTDLRDDAIGSSPGDTFAGFPPEGHADCPMCNYPLTGLPSPHACPECGFEFDSETQVLHSYYPKQAGYVLLAATVYQICLIPILFDFKVIAWNWHVLSFYAVPIGCVALLMHTVIRRRRFPGVLVIGPEGIAYRHCGYRQFTHVLLSEIARVELKRGRWTSYNLQVHRRDGDILNLALLFFRSATQLEPVCENLTRRIGNRSE